MNNDQRQRQGKGRGTYSIFLQDQDHHIIITIMITRVITRTNVIISTDHPVWPFGWWTGPQHCSDSALARRGEDNTTLYKSSEIDLHNEIKIINTQIGESWNLSESECQCVPGLLQQTKPHFVLHRHRKSEMGKEQMLQNEMIPFEFVRKK